MMNQVEIFKTNVEAEEQAKSLVCLLNEQLPLCKINFDLDDCDNILRVEGIEIMIEQVISVLNEKGYHCQLLD